FVQPHLASALQQGMCPENIGPHEGIRADNRAVHMRFSGEMNHCIDALDPEQLLYEHSVADVSMDESELKSVDDRIEIRKVTRIRQSIEHHHPIVWVPSQPEVHEVRTDESGSSGHEHTTHHVFLGSRRED